MTRVGTVSRGYRIVSGGAPPAEDGWARAEVASAQHAAFRGLLDALRAGDVRRDFRVAADAIGRTGLACPSVLEVGCGSGYYAEALDILLDGALVYHGVDLSPAMIELARASYPEARFALGDGADLPFAESSFDIVMNGVSLMHMPRWRAAIAEAARVTRAFVILHTLPMVRERPTTHLEKQAYGGTVREIILNEGEAMAAAADAGLEEVWRSRSIDYDLAHVLGEPSVPWTILFAKTP